MTPLCTRRLLLRELQQADLPAVARLLQNETAMYAYKHAFTDADVQAWLDRQRRRYAAHGFGLWAVVLRETGTVIGQAGLTYQPYLDTQVLEVGYLLEPAYWRRGLRHGGGAGLPRLCLRLSWRGQSLLHHQIRQRPFHPRRGAPGHDAGGGVYRPVFQRRAAACSLLRPAGGRRRLLFCREYATLNMPQDAARAGTPAPLELS